MTDHEQRLLSRFVEIEGELEALVAGRVDGDRTELLKEQAEIMSALGDYGERPEDLSSR